MGANCCAENRTLGGAFDNYNQNPFPNLKMVPVNDKTLQDNYLKNVAARPPQNFARKFDKRPQLLYVVNESRNEVLERPFDKPANQGVYLPPHYHNKFSAFYDGPWDNGQPQGIGKLYFGNGSYYEGNFQKGQVNGNGVYIYPDGSYKRGNFIGADLNGHGIYYNKTSKCKYEGNWKDDKPHGPGIQTYSDGSRFQGQFVKGIKQCALGQYTWPSGKVYRGPFHNGYMNGQGELRMAKGKGIYHGTFSRNLVAPQFGAGSPQMGVMKTETGTYQGPFIDGQFNGRGKFTWYDGKYYEGQFRNGQLHGEGTVYYPNGQKAHGYWHNGENKEIQNVDIRR